MYTGIYQYVYTEHMYTLLHTYTEHILADEHGTFMHPETVPKYGLYEPY